LAFTVHKYNTSKVFILFSFLKQDNFEGKKKNCKETIANVATVGSPANIVTLKQVKNVTPKV